MGYSISISPYLGIIIYECYFDPPKLLEMALPKQSSPFTVSEATRILHCASRLAVIRSPPVKPSGGEVFLFHGEAGKTG
jgi:hypothetical protein